MRLSVLVLLASAAWAAAQSADEIDIKIQAARRAELPFVVKRMVQEAKPADRARVQTTALKVIASKRPASLAPVEATLAENRPVYTEGNENGNRPDKPPGKPHHYGKP